MKPIDLNDIIPREASFELSKLEGGPVTLRALNLDDEMWIDREFGARWGEILRGIVMEPICRLVFRLMSDADKLRFATKTVRIVNEEGDAIEEKRGGVKLLMCYVVGYDQKMIVYRALMETIGVSRPLLDETLAEQKKSLQNLLNEHVGEKSLTSSPLSTAGPLNTSEAEHSEKSPSDSEPSPLDKTAS